MLLPPPLNSTGFRQQPGQPSNIRRHRRSGASTSPLNDILPNFVTERAWFSEVQLPTAYTAVSGEAAWYPLRRLTVPADIGEDMALFAVSVELSPTDPAGAGTPSSGTIAAWGTASGGGAAIVVGVDLPVDDSGWKSAPYFGPSMVASTHLASPAEQPEYLFDTGFPPGRITDTTPQKHRETRSTAPWVYPLANGQSLDVALVLPGAKVAAGAGAGKWIVGGALVTLYLGRRFVRAGGQ